MEKLNEVLNNQYGKSTSRLEAEYQKIYDEDMTFRKIANDLKLPTNTLMKYTSKIISASCELKNCKKCKNLFECKNEIAGYVYYPQKNEENIEFCYIPCKYKLELDKTNSYKNNISYFNVPESLKIASMASIDTKDKNRFELFKWKFWMWKNILVNSYVK